jgi:ribosomal protein L3
MSTIYLPDNPALLDAILTMSDLLHATSTIRTVTVLETDSAVVAQIAGQLLAGMGEEVTAPVVTTEPVAPVHKGVCEFCGKPARSEKSRTCNSVECASAQRKKHQAKYEAKKAAQAAQPEPVEVIVPAPFQMNQSPLNG